MEFSQDGKRLFVSRRDLTMPECVSAICDVLRAGRPVELREGQEQREDASMAGREESQPRWTHEHIGASIRYLDYWMHDHGSDRKWAAEWPGAVAGAGGRIEEIVRISCSCGSCPAGSFSSGAAAVSFQCPDCGTCWRCEIEYPEGTIGPPEASADPPPNPFVVEESPRPDTDEGEREALLNGFREALTMIQDILKVPGSPSLMSMPEHVLRLVRERDRALALNRERNRAMPNASATES